MQARGYDFDALARKLFEEFENDITGESLRQVISGYRLPSWDLAFDLEALTGLSAHDIRDERFYQPSEAA